MRSDEEVSRDVIKALAGDSRISSGEIRAEVDDGIVTLSGQVNAYIEKAVAEEVVARVRGVVDVQNEVIVIPPAPKSDEEISTEVREAMERDVWVDESKISVETVNGVVFMRGTARSASEKEEAENDARWVAGVVDVVNHIRVRPAVKVADAEVARDVRAALLKNTRVDLTEVGVEVVDGIVTLTGKVRSYVEKRIAEYVAYSTPGVVDVLNELAIQAAPKAA